MEYIRESRRPPGRLKGGVWGEGGGAPPGKHIFFVEGFWPKLRNMVTVREQWGGHDTYGTNRYKAELISVKEKARVDNEQCSLFRKHLCCVRRSVSESIRYMVNNGSFCCSNIWPIFSNLRRCMSICVNWPCHLRWFTSIYINWPCHLCKFTYIYVDVCKLM